MTPADAGALWQRFHTEVYAFLRARVGSDDAAQDLLQSAFLRAHKSLVAGTAPENPRAWLYQIVRNLIVDASRWTARERSLANAVASEPRVEETHLTGTPVPGTADDAEAFAVVARALPLFIDGLETPYREAILMTEIEGLTMAEAAQRVGISVSGMKSRVQRGRARLYRALQRCCEFEIDGRGRLIACRRRSPASCCG